MAYGVRGPKGKKYNPNKGPQGQPLNPKAPQIKNPNVNEKVNDDLDIKHAKERQEQEEDGQAEHNEE